MMKTIQRLKFFVVSSIFGLAIFVGLNEAHAQYTPPPGTGFTAGGDLSGTSTSQTVVGVHATTGTINGATVGLTTPAAAQFTTETTTGQSLAENGAVGTPSYTFTNDSATGAYLVGTGLYGMASSGNLIAAFTPSGFAINSAQLLEWGSSGITSPDTILARDAANTLALRNGTNPQTLNLYNTSSSSNANYEQGVLSWTLVANQFSINTKALGTGLTRNLGLGAGGISVGIFNINSFYPGLNASYDLGTSTMHWRNLYQNASLINNGTVIATPTTGATVTIAAGTNLELITPSGSLVALTIVFPVPIADGDTREMVVTQSITGVTFTPTAPATAVAAGGLSSVTTYGSWRFRYVAANTTWYLIP